MLSLESEFLYLGGAAGSAGGGKVIVVDTPVLDELG